MSQNFSKKKKDFINCCSFCFRLHLLRARNKYSLLLLYMSKQTPLKDIVAIISPTGYTYGPGSDEFYK